MDPLLAGRRLRIASPTARCRWPALAGAALALSCSSPDTPGRPSPWSSWPARSPLPRPLTTVEIGAEDRGSHLRYFVFFRSAEDGGPPLGWGLWQAEDTDATLDLLNARDGGPGSWQVVKASDPDGVALLLDHGSASGGPVSEPEVVAATRGPTVTYTVFYRTAAPSAPARGWCWWRGGDPRHALELLNAPAAGGGGIAEVEIAAAQRGQFLEYTVFYRSGAAAAGGWALHSTPSAGAARYFLNGASDPTAIIETASLTTGWRHDFTILYRR